MNIASPTVFARKRSTATPGLAQCALCDGPVATLGTPHTKSEWQLSAKYIGRVTPPPLAWFFPGPLCTVGRNTAFRLLLAFHWGNLHAATRRYTAELRQRYQQRRASWFGHPQFFCILGHATGRKVRPLCQSGAASAWGRSNPTGVSGQKVSSRDIRSSLKSPGWSAGSYI